MRRHATMMSAGILLLALAACGQKQVGFGGQQGTPTPPSGSAGSSASSNTRPLPPQDSPPRDAYTPEPPPGSKVLPQTQIDSSQLPRDYPVRVWTDASGHTLGMFGQEGGCGKVHAELGEQSSSTVRVTLVQVQAGGEMCTMDIRSVPLQVTLNGPLGARVVALALAQR